ncbi:MAG: hypothetical protein ACN6N0_11365 [Microvirgula sp.]
MIRSRMAPPSPPVGVRHSPTLPEAPRDADRQFAALLEPKPAGRAEIGPGPRPARIRLDHLRVRLGRGRFAGLEIEASLSGGRLSVQVTVPGRVAPALGEALVRQAGVTRGDG